MKQCPVACSPVCKLPECEIDCNPVLPTAFVASTVYEGKSGQCKTECETPVCEIRCKKDSCRDGSDGCPDCQTYCNPPKCKETCRPHCAVKCKDPDCTWKCLPRPLKCEKPQCKLVCPKPSCSVKAKMNMVSKVCCDCRNQGVLQYAMEQAARGRDLEQPMPSMLEMLGVVHAESAPDLQCCPCPNANSLIG